MIYAYHLLTLFSCSGFVQDGLEKIGMDHLGKPWGRSARLAYNLRRLADDLDRIASGEGPTDLELAFAPVLSQWRPCMTATAGPAIKGVLSGHAVIPDGERLHAEILAADPELSWVRTWQGFYRLGQCDESASSPAECER